MERERDGAKSGRGGGGAGGWVSRLGVGVDGVLQGAGVGVPELDAAVGGPAAAGEEVGLERAPRKRLDGRLVLGELVEPGVVGDALLVPDVEDVVVGARGELLPRRRPLEAAHLLVVASERVGEVVADAHVVDEDVVVAAGGGEGGAVPGEGGDAGGVAAEGADDLGPGGVPDLNLGAGGADGDVLVVGRPRHGGDDVVRVLPLAQLLDVARARVPQVHGVAEGHAHGVVGGAPVEKVEVVVIGELRGIEDALRGLEGSGGGEEGQREREEAAGEGAERRE